jgi:RHS repeat-associated protein
MPAESKVYEDVANTVKVWDEARKWKKYWMDVFGNLVQVEEPKPAADTGHTGNYFTTYKYDVLGHLIEVSMPRGGVTQERKFNYEYEPNRPGTLLLSAQNPESGTVVYTYHPDGTMATKVDAKGQKTELVYDSYKRVTQVKKYPSVGAPEDEAARVELSYDTNPYEAGYSAYAAGRLTARLYKVNGLTFAEMYSYTRPGQVTKKKLRVGKYFEQPYPYPGSWAYGSLEGRWEYNAEGKMTKVTYPTAAGGGGQSYVYGYDALGRLKTMGPQEAQTSVVSDVTYGPAGEMLTMTGVVNESRGYNSRLQLTSFNGVSYGYGASNNGRIASETVSGETVVYQYDELNRLMKAETQGNVWGQQFTYDGFGNLTNKSVTKGSAPSMSVVVDAQTNRVAGYPYDANGNQLWTNTQTLSYDYENRIAWVDNRNFTGRMYGYDADNRRVYEADWTLVDGTAVFGEQAVHFWGVTGQRLASYGLSLDAGQPPYYGPSVTLTLGSDRVYFGGRLLRGESGWTGEDRLGSVGQFYPYGEARVGDPKRFATYERESGGLDYAVNRYYWVGTGRFMSPDPYMANSGGAGDVADPGSWNRYGYVGGDPVNFNDPGGLFQRAPAPPPESAGPMPTTPTRGAPDPREEPSSGGSALPRNGSPTQVAGDLQEAVRNGEMNDCEAMGEYLANMVSLGGVTHTIGADLTVRMASVTPHTRWNPPGVYGTGRYRLFNHPNWAKPSGYRGDFRESDDKADQGHHFALFFQLGLQSVLDPLSSPGSAVVSAIALSLGAEFFQHWIGGSSNLPDFRLGVEAILFGALFAHGHIGADELKTRFLSTFCDSERATRWW